MITSSYYIFQQLDPTLNLKRIPKKVTNLHAKLNYLSSQVDGRGKMKLLYQGETPSEPLG